jgi:hypothetical protein
MNIDKKRESGQAIIELTMSIVAIMVVFLGVLFAFALGKINVDNIIECRGVTDSYAGNGVSGDYGRPIITWEAGKDERLFTNDDVPVTGASDDPQLFVGELSSGSIDLVNGFNHNYVDNNFAADLDGMFSIFLGVANMTSYNVVTDPYDIESIEALQGAFSSIIYDSDLSVENTVYMPIFYSNE